MDIEDLLNWGAIIVGVVLSIFLVWVFVFALPFSIKGERQFVEACTKAGGIPSKYETMVGKTSRSERLCIKKENIVEIGDE